VIVDVEFGGLGLKVFDDEWGVRRFNVEWDAPEGPMLEGLAEAVGCNECMIVRVCNDGNLTGLFP
jgi:hypothetical protein